MRIIQSVEFSDDFVQVIYVDTDDVKMIAGRPVSKATTLVIPADHPSYQDELATAYDAAEALLEDVVEDYAEAEVFTPSDPAEEELTGMGSG